MALRAPGSGAQVRLSTIVYTATALGPLQVLCRRHIGSYSTVTQTWIELLSAAAALKVDPSFERVGILYDDPTTPPQFIRYDACLVLHGREYTRLQAEGASQLRDGLRLETLPEVSAWHTTHVGSYETLSDAYVGTQEPGRFFTAGFASPSAHPPYYERYHTDPRDTPVDGQVTEVFLPWEHTA